MAPELIAMLALLGLMALLGIMAIILISLDRGALPPKLADVTTIRLRRVDPPNEA